MLVVTKLLSWQKWHLWQLPPVIDMDYRTFNLQPYLCLDTAKYNTHWANPWRQNVAARVAGKLWIKMVAYAIRFSPKWGSTTIQFSFFSFLGDKLHIYDCGMEYLFTCALPVQFVCLLSVLFFWVNFHVKTMECSSTNYLYISFCLFVCLFSSLFWVCFIMCVCVCADLL